MNHTSLLLALSAVSIGFAHTLLGPDHYLPFIALSKSRHWSAAKTAGITALCGFGHILSAAALGLAAASAGSVLTRLAPIESARGGLAAWLLIAFGFVCFVRGVRAATGKRPLIRDRDSTDGHADRRELAPWILFIIFVFGPCEPLIPLIMYPAAQRSMAQVVQVTLIFGASTLATMLTVVLASTSALRLVPRVPLLERFGGALSGGVICSCGMAMAFLGL